jgi:hypothetical protein
MLFKQASAAAERIQTRPSTCQDSRDRYFAAVNIFTDWVPLEETFVLSILRLYSNTNLVSATQPVFAAARG